MKRRHVKFEAEIPPVKLYLDDLLQLEEIMTVGGRKVLISHPKFEDIKSVLDLRDADGEKLRELLIISYLDPGGRAWRDEEIRLNMDRYGISLTIDSSELATIGLRSEIKSFMDAKARSLAAAVISVRRRGAFFLLPFIMVAVILIPVMFPKNPLLSLAPIVICLTWLAFYFVTSEIRYTSIIPKLRKESPTFWSRNKEQFAVQAVTASISAAIGIAIGRAFPPSAQTKPTNEQTPSVPAATMPVPQNTPTNATTKP